MPYWIAGALLAVVLLPLVRAAVPAAVDKAAVSPACARGLAAALPALRGKGLVRGAAGVQRRKVNGLSAEL